MIYTSNYARHHANPNSIAISRQPPEWYNGKCDLSVAPTWSMIMHHKNGEISNDEYKELYLNHLQLSRFNAGQYVESLGDGCFLLCYESPSDFCHRHILAEHLTQQTGVVISEWMNPQETKEYEYLQHVDSLLAF